MKESSLLKDNIKMKKDQLTKWLVDYRETNYKNRPLTDNFWTIVYLGVQNGVDVKSTLGNDIWSYMVKSRPNPFEIYPSKRFKKLGTKPMLINLHLV
jgi:hypothetical protein